MQSVVPVVRKEVYDVALPILNSELTIEELRRENMEPKAQIDALRAQIQSLHQTVDSGALKSAVSSYSVAILDLLKGDQIMNQLRPEVKPVAQRLNSNRMSDCRYLVGDEDPNIIDYKKYILREKIGSIKTEVKSQFDILYPGLLNEVKLYLDTFPPALVKVDEATKAHVDFWWI